MVARVANLQEQTEDDMPENDNNMPEDVDNLPVTEEDIVGSVGVLFAIAQRVPELWEPTGVVSGVIMRLGRQSGVCNLDKGDMFDRIALLFAKADMVRDGTLPGDN